MKNKKVFFIIFLTAVILSIVSSVYLNQRPVRFFILKTHANYAGAFQVGVYLNRSLSTITSLSLNHSQQLKSAQILSAENIHQLESLASSFGPFDFVIGYSQSDQTIDVFWNNFLNLSSTVKSVNNLNAADRLYFALMAKRELTVLDSAGTAINSISTLTEVVGTPTAIVQVKNSVAEPIVRVEILNGCGIKGAADWVVSRVSSQTILAKNGGNAVNFSFANSQLLSSVVAYSDLEKALTALGFTKLNKIGSGILPVGYDGVFIVGKDFQMIKGN